MTDLLLPPSASDLDLHLDEPALAIDRRRRAAANGRAEYHYDALVLAAGSAPVVPSIENIALSGVFVYRTVDDLSALPGYAAGRRVGAVLGSLGRHLRRFGFTVHAGRRCDPAIWAIGECAAITVGGGPATCHGLVGPGYAKVVANRLLGGVVRFRGAGVARFRGAGVARFRGAGAAEMAARTFGPTRSRRPVRSPVGAAAR